RRSSDLCITVDRLWQLLPQLRRVAFHARPGAGSTTGWQGQGYGQIEATVNANDSCRLAENGHFHPAGDAQPVPFRNVYRWQRLGDRLRLSHERFGAANAVFLFELVATDAHHLACVRPHLCGHDDYHGSIALAADGFDFELAINGPRKQERLHYRYRL